MIAVDTSALVAVVFGEQEAERHLAVLQGQETRLSTVSLVEASIVVHARQGPDAARDLSLLVEATIDHLTPVDHEHAQAAVTAWQRFGKGRHPASLNFGDCFSYAVASVYDLPLLYQGDDFTQTDVRSAL